LPCGRGHRSQPHQDQEPANERHLRALSSHRLGRVLPDCVPQEDLSHDRRAADRSRHLVGRLQLSAAESGPLVLWPDPNADPSCTPSHGKRKTPGRKDHSRRLYRSKTASTVCPIKSQLIHITIQHIANSHIRKEDVVAEVLAVRGDHPGLVHVISAMEACPTYKPWHSKETHRTFLRPATGKCLHYYF